MQWSFPRKKKKQNKTKEEIDCAHFIEKKLRSIQRSQFPGWFFSGLND